MKSLKESIETFQGKIKDKGERLTVEELSNKFFPKLAEAFLYGGYIKLGQIRLYLTTIEFYFHAEEDSDIKVKDPIVYHKGEDVDYFPEIMYINPHISGYDITFENPALKYRASVLIREYAIYDEKKKRFLFLKRGSIFDDRVKELKKHLNKYDIELKKGKCNWIDVFDNSDRIIEPRNRIGIKHDNRKWGFRRNNVLQLAEL